MTVESVQTPFEIPAKHQASLRQVLKQEVLKLNQGENEFFVKQRWYGIPEKAFVKGDVENVAEELAQSLYNIMQGCIEDLKSKHFIFFKYFHENQIGHVYRHGVGSFHL